MTDKDFLNWIADRLVFVYGEAHGTDFVLRVRKMAAARTDGGRTALNALLRMVKAFGSGVQASDTAQCGALAEAYACIEASLVAEQPAPALEPQAAKPPTHVISENKGNRVRVLLKSSRRIAGTVRAVRVADFWLSDGNHQHFIPFDQLEAVDVIKALPEWHRKEGWLPFVEFLADHVGDLVLLELQGGEQISGHVSFSDAADGRAWSIAGRQGMEHIELEDVVYAKELASA